MKKYILFDLDGTLTDPMEGITNSVAYALEFYGIHVEDKNTLTVFIGPPLKNIMDFPQKKPQKPSRNTGSTLKNQACLKMQ